MVSEPVNMAMATQTIHLVMYSSFVSCQLFSPTGQPHPPLERNREGPFDECWQDPRFHDKRACMGPGIAGEAGDNLYHRNPQTNELERIDWPYHSPPQEESRDTSVDRGLISDGFTYLGGDSPPMPPAFSGVVYAGRGHKRWLPEEDVQRFVQWPGGMGIKVLLGKPTDRIKYIAQMKG